MTPGPGTAPPGRVDPGHEPPRPAAPRWPTTRPPASWCSSAARRRSNFLQRHLDLERHHLDRAESRPRARPPAICASMAYDPATGQLVLFGGDDGSVLGDTWTWNGTTWTAAVPGDQPARPPSGRRWPTTRAPASWCSSVVRAPAVHCSTTPGPGTARPGPSRFPATSPPARFAASMAYDPGTRPTGALRRLRAPAVLCNDTWTWNGTIWTSESPATSPPALLDAPMAYDPATGQLVLFGGQRRRLALVQ